MVIEKTIESFMKDIMKNNSNSNLKMITRLLFRLLPAQILLAAVGAVNGIVSSFFASNFVGVEAMSAVGLYNPINTFFSALSLMLVGGSVILCGKYLGKNEQDKLQNNFSDNIVLTIGISILFTIIFVLASIFDLTWILTKDALVRPIFNQYLLGQALGIMPLLLGNLFTAFLSIENKSGRTTIASFVYIVVNIILNYLFVQVIKLEALGLALASSLGLWVFLFIQGEYFISRRSSIKLKLKKIDFLECKKILCMGFPGAASTAYQTLRGIILNSLLLSYVGSVGVSAFACEENFLRFFWAIPTGMLAVSRMLMSVSIGEEDRKTLTDIMKVMFIRFLPLMAVVSAGIILCAKPITSIFYQNEMDPVYMLTVYGFRIVPLCMPLSIILMHFVCYGQAFGKQLLVHLLSLLDGVVCVAGFAALLIAPLGIQGVYASSVLNGIVTTIVIIGDAWIKNRHFPRTMDELMVIPKDFGTSDDKRMDLSLKSMDEVVLVAKNVQDFCIKQGIDKRRAYLAGLSMEEMAGNIVNYGFNADKKKHSIDVRVVHKSDDVILRIKDDCIPFDPKSKAMLIDNEDMAKNIGLRIVFRIAKDVQYQNILGLNVLTIRI